MTNKVILSADNTCDIGPELARRFKVNFFYFHIHAGENSYIDTLEISPDELFAFWRNNGVLPKTAAIAPEEYAAHFREWVRAGYEVVHINLGSAISAAYQNCKIAAEELGHVYPVDSASLSTGSGHLVVKAGEMIEQGMGAYEIQQALLQMRNRTQTSFLLDTLEFMAAGGRCSAITAYGANLLRLKPLIRVDNQNGGAMSAGKKYRGLMEKMLPLYVQDQLEGRKDLDLRRIFITHSTCPESYLAAARKAVRRFANFEEIIETSASCTISAHCGPGTVGILFMTK